MLSNQEGRACECTQPQVAADHTDGARTRRYGAPGENIDRANHPWRILTDHRVRDIRQPPRQPGRAHTRRRRAREYGIDPSTVSQIATGRRRRQAS